MGAAARLSCRAPKSSIPTCGFDSHRAEGARAAHLCPPRGHQARTLPQAALAGATQQYLGQLEVAAGCFWGWRSWLSPRVGSAGTGTELRPAWHVCQRHPAPSVLPKHGTDTKPLWQRHPAGLLGFPRQKAQAEARLGLGPSPLEKGGWGISRRKQIPTVIKNGHFLQERLCWRGERALCCNRGEGQRWDGLWRSPVPPPRKRAAAGACLAGDTGTWRRRLEVSVAGAGAGPAGPVALRRREHCPAWAPFGERLAGQAVAAGGTRTSGAPWVQPRCVLWARGTSVPCKQGDEQSGAGEINEHVVIMRGLGCKSRPGSCT